MPSIENPVCKRESGIFKPTWTHYHGRKECGCAQGRCSGHNEIGHALHQG